MTWTASSFHPSTRMVLDNRRMIMECRRSMLMVDWTDAVHSRGRYSTRAQLCVHKNFTTLPSRARRIFIAALSLKVILKLGCSTNSGATRGSLNPRQSKHLTDSPRARLFSGITTTQLLRISLIHSSMGTLGREEARFHNLLKRPAVRIRKLEKKLNIPAARLILLDGEARKLRTNKITK